MMVWEDDALTPPTRCARCDQPHFAEPWGYVQNGFVCPRCIRDEQQARIARLAAERARPRDLPRQRTSAGLCWDDAA